MKRVSGTCRVLKFHRSRLVKMIDLRRPLAVLASHMHWKEIEASLAHRFAREVKAGKKIDDVDLFGATSVLSGAGVSNAGRPRLPLRLMISLLYLKHDFDANDEAPVQCWSVTLAWQYFSGRSSALSNSVLSFENLVIQRGDFKPAKGCCLQRIGTIDKRMTELVRAHHERISTSPDTLCCDWMSVKMNFSGTTK
jgi:hypothetical protein